MEKWKIWSIIGIMSVALIGVALIQVYWLKWSISLDEKNFDSRIKNALYDIKELIDADIKKKIQFQNFQKPNSGFNDIQKDTNWRINQIIDQTKSLEYSLNPDVFLETLDPIKVQKHVSDALANRGIDIEYSYGIFSNKYKEFIILNDHYTSAIKAGNSSDVSLKSTNIYNTKYKIPLLATEFKSPGSLNIVFQEWKWQTILPTLLLTLIFTLLILFAFSYTIYAIFKQKKISQMKTDFVNNMTHEFKTPIATISLATDSLLSPMVFNNKEQMKKFINIIKDENSRLLNQVENVLQVAKLDKKKIQLSISKVDIHKSLNETIEHLRLKMEAKDTKIIKSYNATDNVIEADEIHIINIFSNIIENALKYSIDNPIIKISTKNTKQGIEISVEDNGIGMTKDELHHIFDKFYRVSTGNVHNIKGFGLGLAYVKSFVEAHNGTIFVDSKKNKGSTFTIHFPKKM